jgi:kinesin family protein 23
VAVVELSTVMQPLMKQRKSVTKLTDVKDITNPEISKYCLMTQDQDSSGELETRLYKVILFIRVCFLYM